MKTIHVLLVVAMVAAAACEGTPLADTDSEPVAAPVRGGLVMAADQIAHAGIRWSPAPPATLTDIVELEAPLSESCSQRLGNAFLEMLTASLEASLTAPGRRVAGGLGRHRGVRGDHVTRHDGPPSSG